MSENHTTLQQRRLLTKIADALETLERIAKLTPEAANAHNARDLYLTVNAIATCCIARLKE